MKMTKHREVHAHGVDDGTPLFVLEHEQASFFSVLKTLDTVGDRGRCRGSTTRYQGLLGLRNVARKGRREEVATWGKRRESREDSPLPSSVTGRYLQKIGTNLSRCFTLFLPRQDTPGVPYAILFCTQMQLVMFPIVMFPARQASPHNPFTSTPSQEQVL